MKDRLARLAGHTAPFSCTLGLGTFAFAQAPQSSRLMSIDLEDLAHVGVISAIARAPSAQPLVESSRTTASFRVKVDYMPTLNHARSEQ